MNDARVEQHCARRCAQLLGVRATMQASWRRARGCTRRRLAARSRPARACTCACTRTWRAPSRSASQRAVREARQVCQQLGGRARARRRRTRDGGLHDGAQGPGGGLGTSIASTSNACCSRCRRHRGGRGAAPRGTARAICAGARCAASHEGLLCYLLVIKLLLMMRSLFTSFQAGRAGLCLPAQAL
jgi:hypothetical protein